ncbi:MAG: carboxypeptidase [Anaerolineales bacterium]|nr:carboxypeptidase [Anaerolineales bacterium]
MPTIHFNRYYRYPELTTLLHAYAEEYPHLVKIESIGKSYEGRDIWVLTITHFATGPDTEKPAFWVDGNIHATEVSTSTACLYHLHTLVTQYGTDPDITRCLDTRAFYLCPRINSDGVELALADSPKFIRSSVRPYPYDEDPLEGLIEEDIDGDGRILTMRVPDPNGAWKPHADDPRALVRRDPTEVGGTYYRLLPEGHLKNYDGVTITVQRPKEGLDINRNFPYDWRQENEQRGAGPYPASEPEIRAMVDFIIRHKNITGGLAFHTFSGVILRPYSNKADDAFPAEDLWTFQKIGEKGTELTQYPNISIFHDFRYHPKQVITGTLDWLYESQGAFMWAVEIWSPTRQAGIEVKKPIDWFREHPVEDDLKMLKWNDEKLDGTGYVNWYPFNHPQLGPIELGGWDTFPNISNPPAKFLEAEVARFPKWLVWQLLLSPKMELFQATATQIGTDTYRVRLVVQNTGWLPSYVTKKALEKQVIRGVICEIELPEGATLQTGKPRNVYGQLEGRAYKGASDFFGGGDDTTDRLKVEWVIHAPRGGTVNLLARHERAGVVRTTVELK